MLFQRSRVQRSSGTKWWEVAFKRKWTEKQTKEIDGKKPKEERYNQVSWIDIIWFLCGIFYSFSTFLLYLRFIKIDKWMSSGILQFSHSSFRSYFVEYSIFNSLIRSQANKQGKSELSSSFMRNLIFAQWWYLIV